MMSLSITTAVVGGKRFELVGRNSFLMATLLVVQMLTLFTTTLSSPVEYRQYNFVDTSPENNVQDVAASDVEKPTILQDRIRRDLRASRKISSSSMPIAMMPAYYPFVMAEMMAGSIKTRHPSVVAINGCPAYYIADHNGKCRQVFQYTVNFGQPALRFQPAQYVPPTSFQNPWSFPSRAISRINPHGPSPKPVKTIQSNPVPKPVSFGSKGGISDLLRNAAKRFDLSFLKRSSPRGSTEKKDPAALSSLRDQILAALKIPSKKNGSKNPSPKHRSNIPKYDIIDATTTPDYDD